MMDWCRIRGNIFLDFFAAKEDKAKKNSAIMTEIELQSQLMSYADRFASILHKRLF